MTRLADLANRLRRIARGGDGLVVAGGGYSARDLEIAPAEARAIADAIDPPTPRPVKRPAAATSPADRRMRQLEDLERRANQGDGDGRTREQDDEFHRLRREVYHQWAGSAAAWSPIVAGDDGGGRRDFLDGKPISCGTFLELQATEDVPIDDGEIVARRLATGVIVRYEGRPGDHDRITLHASVGNHEFTAALQPWMRFRWPR